VAERASGWGLELRGLPGGRSDEDGAACLIEIIGAEAESEFAHPSEIPRHEAFGAVDLEAVIALVTNAGAARFQRGTRARFEAQQAVQVVLVLDGTEFAAVCERVVAGYPGRTRPLRDEHCGVGDDGGDVSEQVPRKVDAV